MQPIYEYIMCLLYFFMCRQWKCLFECNLSELVIVRFIHTVNKVFDFESWCFNFGIYNWQAFCHETCFFFSELFFASFNCCFLFRPPHCLCTGSKPGRDPVPDRPTGRSNWYGSGVHCTDSVPGPVYEMGVQRTNSCSVDWRNLSH